MTKDLKNSCKEKRFNTLTKNITKVTENEEKQLSYDYNWLISFKAK